jgi:excisionase family DNA binding protein
MTHLTIREASQLIDRTSATIRRYIRSGRLKAEKEIGKFGEEYRIRRDDLLALGFSPADPPPPGETALQRSSPVPAPVPVSHAVPISVFNELLMKHEQILVQYGMIRAGGQKLLEYKADAESKAEEIRRAKDRYEALRQRALREISFLRKRLREMELQMEERSIEVTVLQDKLRRLDPLGPGLASGEALAASLDGIRQQQKAVAELAADEPRAALSFAAGEPWTPGFPPLDRKEDH